MRVLDRVPYARVVSGLPDVRGDRGEASSTTTWAAESGRSSPSTSQARGPVIGETLSLYDGWNLVEERYADDTTKKAYVWGLDLSGSLQGAGGIGGLVYAADGITSHHYLYDANGNVGQLVDATTGAVVAHYEYNPFGRQTYASGVVGNAFRFSTKYNDDELDSPLVYYGCRYYSPELGRWLTRDPVGEEDGFGLYSFVNSNPVNKRDKWGLFTLDEAEANLRSKGVAPQGVPSFS